MKRQLFVCLHFVASIKQPNESACFRLLVLWIEVAGCANVLEGQEITNREQAHEALMAAGYQVQSELINPALQGDFQHRRRYYFVAISPVFLGEHLGQTLSPDQVDVMLDGVFEDLRRLHNSAHVNFELSITNYLLPDHAPALEVQQNGFEVRYSHQRTAADNRKRTGPKTSGKPAKKDEERPSKDLSETYQGWVHLSC